MTLRLHAILLALNEEVFIGEQLRFLYPRCQGISVLTQYDRDWYGRRVRPDATVERVLAHPDPEGKITLVVRRWPDETAARNEAMAALSSRPDRRVVPHGSPPEAIRAFHRPPDYFLVVDADEFFDEATFPAVVEHLERTRPPAMRMRMLNYLGTWNRRLPVEVAPMAAFGFVRPGLRFERQRNLSLREFRLSGYRVNNPLWQWSRRDRFLARSRLADLAERAYGFTRCPEEVGVVHHAQFVGTEERVRAKLRKSSNRFHDDPRFVEILRRLPTERVSTDDLPRNIREGEWPAHFFESEPESA